MPLVLLAVLTASVLLCACSTPLNQHNAPSDSVTFQPLLFAVPTYSAAQLRRFPWLVSSDTLKLTDCASAWTAALEAINSLRDLPATAGLDASDQELLTVAAAAPDDLVPDQVERLSWLVNESLFAALNSAAPIGFWFGSHPGDGALFGFWLDETISDSLGPVGCADDPETVSALLQELEANGISLDNISDAFQGIAYGVTAETAGADFAQETYASQLSSADSAALLQWPLRCIDWQQAWQELRCDGYVLIRHSDSAFSVWLP